MLELVDVGKRTLDSYRGVVPDHLLHDLASTPVVAGRARRHPAADGDGVGGLLVDSVEGCAGAIAELLADRERARALGAAGRDRVREHFLTPRLVLNYLRLVNDLAAGRPVERDPAWARKHDPVCGMALGERPEPRVSYADVEYGFCSARCRARFLDRPERYAGQQAWCRAVHLMPRGSPGRLHGPRPSHDRQRAGQRVSATAGPAQPSRSSVRHSRADAARRGRQSSPRRPSLEDRSAAHPVRVRPDTDPTSAPGKESGEARAAFRGRGHGSAIGMRIASARKSPRGRLQAPCAKDPVSPNSSLDRQPTEYAFDLHLALPDPAAS